MKENSTYSFCETEFFSSSVLEADFENPVYIEPLVDNWTYNPKNEKVYFENSAIHFSPKMNGAAIVRKEPFSTTIFLFITYRVKGNFTFENTANSQKSVDLMLYKLDALGSQIIDSQVVATITTDGGFNYVLPINDSASYVIGWKTSKSAKFKLTSYGVTSSFGFPPFNTTTNLQVGNFSNPEIIKPSYDGWTIDTKTQNLVYSDRSTHCLAPSRGIHKNFITQANTQYKFSGDVKYLPNEVVVFPPFGLTGDAEEDTIVPQSFNTPDSLKITDISSSPVRITGVQFNKTTSIEKYFQATSGLTQIEFLLSSILESGYAYYVDNLKLEQILGGSTLYTSSFTNQDVVFSDLDGWETDWNSSYLSATTDTPNKLRVAGEAPQTERLFNVTPGLEYELIYTQTDNNAVDLLIEESANGTSWQSVYSASSSNGTQSVTFTPSNSLIKVSFESTNAFKLHDISLEGELYDTLITVESFGGTPWRYNWNTQERVPEIQKDHYTAPYWEYDPRVVHRWNLDPVTFPWQSPYVINNNNPILFNDAGGDIPWPTIVNGARFTSPFGTRVHPVFKTTKKHKGIDLSAPEGTAIRVAAAGTVIRSGYESNGFGNQVWVDHGDGYVTVYAHMYKLPSVKVGESVRDGQVIGGVGTTGVSTGNHLHFEIHKDGVPIDPESIYDLNEYLFGPPDKLTKNEAQQWRKLRSKEERLKDRIAINEGLIQLGANIERRNNKINKLERKLNDVTDALNDLRKTNNSRLTPKIEIGEVEQIEFGF